jgi:hypothetical protein
VNVRTSEKSVEVFANIGIGEGEMHVAWHFPGTAPVSVSVGLPRARAWTEVLIAQGRRNRGAPETRNLAAVQPAGDSDPEGKLAQVGADIYATIFTQPVEERWNQTFDGRGDDCVIHIVFQWDSTLREKGLDPALIPFESMRRPGEGAGRLARITADFVLAKNISIERRITNSRGGGPSVPRRRRGLKVLVFTAPIDFEDPKRNKEAEESRGVAEAVRKAGRGKAIRTETLISASGTRATWGAFCQAVQGRDVVHFIGHGKIEKGIGYLLFETDEGKKDWVAMPEVATALKSAGVWLLVLNCCETVSFSSFACEFPAVIGHQYVITDPSVEAFEQAFFRNLLETHDIAQSVWAGRQAIKATGPDTRWEYRTPVLYLQARKKRNPVLVAAAALILAAATGMASLLGYQQFRQPALIETDVVVSVTQTVDGRTTPPDAAGAAIRQVFADAGFRVEVDDRGDTGPDTAVQLARRYRFRYAVIGDVRADAAGTREMAGTTQHAYVAQADLRLVGHNDGDASAAASERDQRAAQSPADAARRAMESAAMQAASQLAPKATPIVQEGD